MTTEQQWFLQALKRFIHPGTADAVPGMDPLDSLETVWRLAYLHTVLPLVYDSVADLPATDNATESLKARWKQQTLQAVFRQAIQSQTFLGLCRAFQGAGLKVLVVKGILCRILYPKADYRTSSDEDVYVSPLDFPAVHQILLEQGLKITDPVETAIETAQVVTYMDCRTGLRIELHRQLFSPDSTAYGQVNDFFQDAANRAVQIEIDGATVWSMCPTDHMLYLLFHAYKHFLHSGFGIRQVCDINLYAERYNMQIDWPQVHKSLALYHADVFAAALWKIGSEYLGFSPSGYIPVSVPPVEDLLLDILTGGVYGSSSKNRQHSSLMTLHAASGHGGNVLHTIFPGKNALKGRFHYLQDKPWLLPAAWAQRLFGYLRKRDNTSASESIRIGTQRVALLKKYGILK